MRTRSQVRITGESCTRLYPPKKGGRKKKRMAETCGELFVEDGHAPSVGLARNVSAPSIDVQSPPGSKSKQGKKVVKPTGGTKGTIPISVLHLFRINFRNLLEAPLLSLNSCWSLLPLLWFQYSSCFGEVSSRGVCCFLILLNETLMLIFICGGSWLFPLGSQILSCTIIFIVCKCSQFMESRVLK